MVEGGGREVGGGERGYKHACREVEGPSEMEWRQRGGGRSKGKRGGRLEVGSGGGSDKEREGEGSSEGERAEREEEGEREEVGSARSGKKIKKEEK